MITPQHTKTGCRPRLHHRSTSNLAQISSSSTIKRNNNGASCVHLRLMFVWLILRRHETARRRSQCCFAFASSRRQILESSTRGEHGTFHTHHSTKPRLIVNLQTTESNHGAELDSGMREMARSGGEGDFAESDQDPRPFVIPHATTIRSS